jgi:hypothetical protein
MKITADQLLDEALAIRGEATLVGRCPRCGSNDATMPAPEPGAYREGTFGHEPWCPAIDDSILKLFRRTGAEVRHYPLKGVGLDDGRPVLFVLLGRKGKRPLDDDQLEQLLTQRVSREGRN